MVKGLVSVARDMSSRRRARDRRVDAVNQCHRQQPDRDTSRATADGHRHVVREVAWGRIKGDQTPVGICVDALQFPEQPGKVLRRTRHERETSGPAGGLEHGSPHAHVRARGDESAKRPYDFVAGTVTDTVPRSRVAPWSSSACTRIEWAPGDLPTRTSADQP